jgi:hypothetical protein
MLDLIIASAVEKMYEHTHPSKPPPAGVFALVNSPLTLKLVASKTYFRARSYDARAQLERAFRFTLPAEIALADGNAKNHFAQLSFRLSTGTSMTCQYRGGSDQSHPKGSEQIAKGLRYKFKHCSSAAGGRRGSRRRRSGDFPTERRQPRRRERRATGGAPPLARQPGFAGIRRSS